jgi:hypothetical protein
LTTDRIEAEIARTTATVEHWQQRAAALHTALAEVSRPLAEAEAERNNLAQAFGAGDLKAGDKLAGLRKVRAEAEASVSDLQLALQHVESELKAASEEQFRALKLREAEETKAAARERLRAAEAVDAALANLARAMDAWEESGAPLLTLDAPSLRGSDYVGRRDAVMNPKRVGNAAAAIVQRVFPALIIAPFGNGTPLAASERSLWHGLL